MTTSDSKGRLLGELLQNAFDENVTLVKVSLQPQSGRSAVDLVIEDDSPDGFRELDHAYRLFAESAKKGDPTKRGRFNLGEKIVLAHCESAEIASTTGKIVFLPTGERQDRPRRKRERGTVFKAVLKLTRAELDEVNCYLRSILVPAGIQLEVNGQQLPSRVPVRTLSTQIETIIADDSGVLRERVRKTEVEIHDVLPGEMATLYEMGLPIITTGDKYHVNVLQKVPQSLSRDGVKPAYLRKLRTAVINAMHELLDEEDVNAAWVQEATSSPDCSDDAMARFLDLRFGENRASYDPSDREAGHAIQAGGGTVVTGRMLNGQQWENARRANAIQPAGVIHPSPKAYGNDPNAPSAKEIHPDDWTPAMQNVVAYTRFLASELMGVNLRVRIVETGNSFLACYGGAELHFNLRHLGRDWFFQGASEAVDRLLIHEFGHQYCGDHLDDAYHDALCRLGAKLKALAMDKPDAIRAFERSLAC
ncbi:MAG: ATP-binding protein [Pirellulales bacterium]|nr:ATP-binding protein [Pirellulales bacterium]